MIADVKNFEILTDDIENSFRLNLCNSCEMKRTDTICDACACPIEYVITYKFKNCPLNKWTI